MFRPPNAYAPAACSFSITVAVTPGRQSLRSADPHVPEAGRVAIDGKLRDAKVDYAVKLYPAEHAFMRDEGPRYDPEVTDQAFADMIGLFRTVFGPRYT